MTLVYSILSLYVFNIGHLTIEENTASRGMLLKRGMGNGEWEIENGKLNFLH